LKVKLYGAKSKMMKVYFKVPPNVGISNVSRLKYWFMEEIGRGEKWKNGKRYN